MRHWKKALAVIFLAAAVYFVAVHTTRFLSDFWPLDKSTVAPNLLASVIQWAILLIAAYLLYPPVKRAIDEFTRRHVDSIKAHATSEAAKIHERIDHTHARIDAIHEHLGITPGASETILESPMTPVKPKRVRKIVPKL